MKIVYFIFSKQYTLRKNLLNFFQYKKQTTLRVSAFNSNEYIIYDMTLVYQTS